MNPPSKTHTHTHIEVQKHHRNTQFHQVFKVKFYSLEKRGTSTIHGQNRQTSATPDKTKLIEMLESRFFSREFRLCADFVFLAL